MYSPQPGFEVMHVMNEEEWRKKNLWETDTGYSLQDLAKRMEENTSPILCWDKNVGSRASLSDRRMLTGKWSPGACWWTYI